MTARPPTQGQVYGATSGPRCHISPMHHRLHPVSLTSNQVLPMILTSSTKPHPIQIRFQIQKQCLTEAYGLHPQIGITRIGHIYTLQNPKQLTGTHSTAAQALAALSFFRGEAAWGVNTKERISPPRLRPAGPAWAAPLFFPAEAAWEVIVKGQTFFFPSRPTVHPIHTRELLFG